MNPIFRSFKEFFFATCYIASIPVGILLLRCLQFAAKPFMQFLFATLAVASIPVGILFCDIPLIRAMSSGDKLVSLEFEVYGMVQGVFFRKHTVEKSKQLGLKGWCMNTERGTVLGKLEGDAPKVEEMKRWLKYTGSPMSKIEKAEFRDEKPIDSYTFSDFKVRH